MLFFPVDGPNPRKRYQLPVGMDEFLYGDKARREATSSIPVGVLRCYFRLGFLAAEKAPMECPKLEDPFLF